MNMGDELESKLRVRFEHLRAQETRQAPKFEPVWGGALARQGALQSAVPIWRRLGFAGATAAILVITGWLAWPTPARIRAEGGREAWERLFAPLEQELASAGSRWVAPTDFLLAPAPGPTIGPFSHPSR
jgi:hypothetical protein